MNRFKFFGALFLLLAFFSFPIAAHAAPSIANISAVTTGNIEKYAKFEVKFNINNMTATNPYWPYVISAPPGVTSGTGITVDMLLLSPGESNWTTTKTLPCFYFQPYEEVGSADNAAFLPVGKTEWRCRFTPEITGTYQYKIKVQDAGGTAESAINQFTAVNSSRKGFIKVSSTDPRFFEYSDGTPFVAPLLNMEENSPFNGLANMRVNIAKLGQNGIRFVRWFPTGEGANMEVSPFSDDMRYYWGFGAAWAKMDDVDSTKGKKFSFAPYYYSAQYIPAIAGAKYRLTFRAHVTGERVLRAEIGNFSGGQLEICSNSNQQHAPCQNVAVNTCGGTSPRVCRSDNWQSYEIIAANSNNSDGLGLAMRGVYISSDGSTPRSGSVRFSDAQFQRDETGNGDWGGNQLYHSDPDGYDKVDQVGAMRLDEIFRLSEQYGVYHKLTVFHKNDGLLNTFQADGSVGDWATCDWSSDCHTPNNFYSEPGQAARWYEDAYTRYFVARWSYSTSLHSLELGNECDLWEKSYQAGWHLADLVHQLSPRYVLVGDSFWGYWVSDFYANPVNGQKIDYSDKHWYADHRNIDCATNPDGCEVISGTWQDSAANVRQCYLRFKEYAKWFDYTKPIVRGETGVGLDGTEPVDPQIAAETNGTYFHKKMWAHVGSLGYSCDGEWYPRVFSTGGAYPNTTYSPEKIFAAYEKFMTGEPLNNGTHVDIGTDNVTANTTSCTSGDHCIINSNSNLRAFGSKDPATKRVLVWVDNKNNTWTNNPGGATSASGNFKITGMPAGSYTRETWDTRAGTYTTTQNAVTVGANGELTFTAATGKDAAYKFYIPGVVVPTSTPTSTPAHCSPLGDIDCSGKVTALDLSTLLSKFNTNDIKSDLDDSGQVNALDLFKLLQNFGK